MDLKKIIENVRQFDIGHAFNKIKQLSLIDVMHIVRHWVLNNTKNILIALAFVGAGVIGLIIYAGHMKSVNEEALRFFTSALNSYNYALRSKDVSPEDQKKYLQRALGLWQQVLAKYPTTSAAADALFYFGNGLYVSQNYDQAIQKFEEYVKKYPKKYLAPYALENIGFCYEQKSDFKNAVKYYDLLKEKYPRSSIAGKSGLDKGRCYEALNDWNKAAESYRSVLTYAPNSVWARDAQIRLGFLESKFKYMSANIKKVKK